MQNLLVELFFSFSEDKFIVSDTKFISNTVKRGGGAINAMNLIIICSSFRRNKAGYGGAIIVRRSLDIKNTTFEHNLAEYSNGYGGGRGGAFIMTRSSKGHISDSLFKDNMALSVGGSIYSMFECSLSIKRTLFQINSYSSRYHHSRGVILHSSGNLLLKGVSFKDLDKQNIKNSLIVHTGIFQGIKINNVIVTCSTGKDILADVAKKPIYIAKKALAILLYHVPHALHIPTVYLQEDLVQTLNHIHCHKCPFGGNCTDGRIKAASNFWGHVSNRSTGQIHFSACPFGYGCSGSSCKHYDSCGTGRKGVLCEQCKKGLTEGIVTHD